MIHGLDTGFLVAAEVREHVAHANARATLARVLSTSDFIAIAPQVLAEFIHVVTDPRRFTQPLDMSAARRVAGRAVVDVKRRRASVPRRWCRAAVSRVAATVLVGPQATARYAPCRNLVAGRNPIAPHHQPVGLPGFRCLYLHRA